MPVSPSFSAALRAKNASDKFLKAVRGGDGGPSPEPSPPAGHKERKPRPCSAPARQSAEQISRRLYDADRAKVSFDAYTYPDGVGPGPDFFHLLAPVPPDDRPAPKGGAPPAEPPKLHGVLLPPTLVSHDYSTHVYYTSKAGEVERRDHLKGNELYQLFLSGRRASEMTREERAVFESVADAGMPGVTPRTPRTPRGHPVPLVAAVQKTRRGARNDACVVLQHSLRKAVEAPSGRCVVQRFVDGGGPTASVVRSVWRPDGAGAAAHCGWVISSRDRRARGEAARAAVREATNPAQLTRRLACATCIEADGAASVTAVAGDKIEALRRSSAAVAAYVEKRPGFRWRFEELVCDYLRDEDGRWWLLQVKAFKLAERRPKPERPWSAARSAAALVGRARQEQRCHGDYCHTLSREERVAELERSAEAVASAKGVDRAGAFSTLKSKQRRQLAEEWFEREQGSAFTSAAAGKRQGRHTRVRKVLTQRVAHRSIVLDREERESEEPPYQWLVAEGPASSARGGLRGEAEGGGPATWLAFGPEDREALERGHREGLKMVELSARHSADLAGKFYYRDDNYGVVSERRPIRRDPPVMADDPPEPSRVAAKAAKHHRYSAFYYDLVPVCDDCYRVYMYKDRRRLLRGLKRAPPDPSTGQPKNAVASVIHRMEREEEEAERAAAGREYGEGEGLRFAAPGRYASATQGDSLRWASTLSFRSGLRKQIHAQESLLRAGPGR